MKAPKLRQNAYAKIINAPWMSLIVPANEEDEVAIPEKKLIPNWPWLVP